MIIVRGILEANNFVVQAYSPKRDARSHLLGVAGTTGAGSTEPGGDSCKPLGQQRIIAKTLKGIPVVSCV
jgi:hypothetical protein